MNNPPALLIVFDFIIRLTGEMPMQLLNTIYSIVDGCTVQHQYGTVLHSLSYLTKSRNVRYVRCIQAPGHGKAEVDAAGGHAKMTAQK